jgi:hypothetical protein
MFAANVPVSVVEESVVSEKRKVEVEKSLIGGRKFVDVGVRMFFIVRIAKMHDCQIYAKVGEHHPNELQRLVELAL